MKNLVDVIDDYAFRKMTDGLVLLSLPTGAGKSSAVYDFISKTLKEGYHKDKILFITSLKKNLQVEELEKRFKTKEEKLIYENSVLVLKSNFDFVFENLPKLIEENKIPEEIMKSKVFRTLWNNINNCIQREKCDDPVIINSVNEIKKQIREKYEPSFRRYIKKAIYTITKALNNDEPASSTFKLKYIKTNMQWLIELYPQILYDERQVYLMSMDKFLLRTDPIYEASFYNYTKLIEKAIVFIDEFDATKNTMLNRLIDNATSKPIDYVAAFRIINDRLNQGNFPAEMIRPSKFLEDKGEEKLVTEEISKLKEMCDKYVKKFNLEYIFKNKELDSGNLTFLFQDIRNLIISGNPEKKKLFYKTNNKLLLNEIFLNQEVQENSKLITYMLRSVEGFLDYFCTAVYILGINYKDNKNAAGEEFSFENGILSVLDCFFPGENNIYSDFFYDKIVLYRRSKEYNKLKKFDNSFFENGFSYYTIEDDESHDLRSEILTTILSTTPEQIISEICQKARVFGISATANLDSVIGNFALKNYLIPNLKDTFYTLTNEENKVLEKRFNNSICDYSNAEIKTQAITSPELYNSTCWEEVFGEELGEILFNLIQQESLSENNNQYFEKRYFRIGKVFKAFIENHNINSFLCMLTAFPKEDNPNMDIKTLRIMFDKIAKGRLSFDDNVVILKSGHKYEYEKENLLNRLSNGEKILVISTYVTVGAGQNLQYRIPEQFRKDVVKINKFKESSEKDFDGIYLEEPTNLLVNLKSRDSYSNLLKYLYQMESLAEIGEISFAKKQFNITEAFRTVFFGSKKKSVSSKYSESYKIFATSCIIQAVGRICRTNMKNHTIYILYDSNIGKAINKDVCKNQLLNPEFRKLLESIDVNEEKDSQMEKFQNAAIITAKNVLPRIYRFIEDGISGWNENAMEEWAAIRRLLLKSPTMTEEEYNNCLELVRPFYIELDQDRNKYWFKRSGDYDDINDISFTMQEDYEEVSAESARLDCFAKIPEVNKFFKSHNFALEFKPKKYILSPPAFTNIYKGGLGEYCGREILKGFGIDLEDITEKDFFELFDYKVPDKKIYVDFKHWNEYSFYIPKESDIQEHILNKMKKCSAKVAIIINIFAEQEYVIKDIEKEGCKIIEIPYLYNQQTLELNQKAINKIIQIIEEN